MKRKEKKRKEKERKGKKRKNTQAKEQQKSSHQLRKRGHLRRKAPSPKKKRAVSED